MAELADAQASGACDGNIVRVQIPFPAFRMTWSPAYICRASGVFMKQLIDYTREDKKVNVSAFKTVKTQSAADTGYTYSNTVLQWI